MGYVLSSFPFSWLQTVSLLSRIACYALSLTDTLKLWKRRKI